MYSGEMNPAPRYRPIVLLANLTVDTNQQQWQNLAYQHKRETQSVRMADDLEKTQCPLSIPAGSQLPLPVNLAPIAGRARHLNATTDDPQKADPGGCKREQKEVPLQALPDHLPPFAKCWSITSRIQTDKPIFRDSAADVHFSSWAFVNLTCKGSVKFAPRGRPFAAFLDAFFMPEIYTPHSLAPMSTIIFHIRGNSGLTNNTPIGKVQTSTDEACDRAVCDSISSIRDSGFSARLKSLSPFQCGFLF